MKSGFRKFSVFGSLISITSGSLLTLFYPQECRLCEKPVEFKEDGFICNECWKITHFLDKTDVLCQKCGAFLKTGSLNHITFCHRCENDSYDLARSAGIYEKALAISILSLKRQPFLPVKLRKIILDSFLNSPFQDADLIIPVPLSTRRLRERGFNQSLIIARFISKYTAFPVDENSLRRQVHTEKHRAGMDEKSRYESVRNSFAVKRPRIIEGKNVLLVDDVFTSGATVSSCADVLKKNGAKKVYVLTVARAFR